MSLELGLTKCILQAQMLIDQGVFASGVTCIIHYIRQCTLTLETVVLTRRAIQHGQVPAGKSVSMVLWMRPYPSSEA